MRVKFTAKTIENITPPNRGRLSLWDATLPGFGIRVTDSGSKSWVLMYRVRSRQRRMTLGRYPAFSLADAREEAREALRKVDRGIDPQQEKLEAKRKPTTLFPDIAAQFIELYARPKNRTWKQTEQMLKRNAVPKLKNLALEEINRHHVIDILDEIVARGAPLQANRTLSHLRKLFNWCVSRGMLEHNPIIGLKPPGKETSRDRVLTDVEIKKVWSAWDEIGFPFGPMYKLLLLTGQRRNELANMRWSDIHNDTWTIPREIAKNDRTHEVPLSPFALEIIECLPRIGDQDLIFSTNGRNPASGFSRAKQNTDVRSGVTDWRLHDLRRTAASGMARLGIAPHVVEKILNHSTGTISGVAAVYNRYGYDDEKRKALVKWSEHLVKLVSRRQD
ncbi:MAG: integrase arm-type DNA-binding domain-containing protein [Alphaproteobacteria bacterium]